VMKATTARSIAAPALPAVAEVAFDYSANPFNPHKNWCQGPDSNRQGLSTGGF